MDGTERDTCQSCLNRWRSRQKIRPGEFIRGTDKTAKTGKKLIVKGKIHGDLMKKKITVILEIESDDEFMMSNEFIKNDLKTEINCASNSYDVVSIDVENIQLR